MFLVLGMGLLTVLFYSLVRALFLFWNFSLYQNQVATDLFASFIYALRFDLSAIAMLSIPAVLVWSLLTALRKNPVPLTKWSFLFVQGFFLVLNCYDIEYVQFTGRRFTVSVVTMVLQAQGKFLATLSAYTGLLSLVTVLMILYVGANQIFASWYLKRSTDKKNKNWIWQLVAILVLGVFARGGLQKKPLGFAHAQVFANPILNHLTINSSFSFLQSLRRQNLPREHYMPDEEMSKLMNGTVSGQNLADAIRPSGPQNVVVIILESFSLEHMGSPHGDKGYTPFLDSLALRGLFFPNAFANARRSIEGMAAIIGGIPALMNDPFISSQFASNSFYGLGTRLGSHGYSSSFFHGGENGTMYFDQFTRSAGFAKYYGANEYGVDRDHDGSWGIWDGPFFQYAIQKMGGQKPPFVTGIFSLSSHNPFRVPPEQEGRFPKGSSEIHEVVGYTDQALADFFASAEKTEWYKNTLFVITADHTYKAVRAAYQDSLGDYRVPILFYHPQIKSWPALDRQEPVGHIDILPSILDFLGILEQNHNLLGRSVFREGPRTVVLHSEGFYWLIRKGKLFTEDSGGTQHLYQLDEAPPKRPNSIQEVDLLAHPEFISERDKLSHILKAHRQYFSQGLWDNRLYYPRGR